MNIAMCRLCGVKINTWVYSNALFCDDYCRKRYCDIIHGRRTYKSVLKRLKGALKNN